jgi:hypothetical protein
LFAEAFAVFTFIHDISGRPSDRDFERFLDVFLTEAAEGTRARRRQEIHRGRSACVASAMCGDCTAYTLDAAWDTFARYARQTSTGAQTSLRSAIDNYLDSLDEGVDPSTSLIRAAFASGGKNAERQHAVREGRAARPDQALKTRTDFQPLRDLPVMLHIALFIVEFAASNTALPASVLPYDKIAESLAHHASELKVRRASVAADQVPRLVNQALDIIEAIDADWARANISAPISARKTEFVSGDANEVGEMLSRLSRRAA